MERLSKFLSYLFHPLFTSFYVVVALLLVHPSIKGRIESIYFLQICLLLFLSLVAIPLLSIYVVYKSGYLHSYQMHHRKERIIPFLFISIMMFIISYKLIENSGLEIVGWWILSAGLALLLSIPILYFWMKPSAHVMPLSAGVALFLHEGFEWYSNDLIHLATVTVLILGLVASARLYLKAHKPVELLIGTILGILVILPFI